MGVQIHPHRNDHAYRVVDNLSFPLFHPDWGVRHLTFPLSMLADVSMCAMNIYKSCRKILSISMQERAGELFLLSSARA